MDPYNIATHASAATGQLKSAVGHIFCRDSAGVDYHVRDLKTCSYFKE